MGWQTGRLRGLIRDDLLRVLVFTQANKLGLPQARIDPKGAEVTYPEEALQKGVAYKGRWLPLRVTSELREKVPFIYIDVQRDYRRHSAGSRWAVLRRLNDAQRSSPRTD